MANKARGRWSKKQRELDKAYACYVQRRERKAGKAAQSTTSISTPQQGQASRSTDPLSSRTLPGDSVLAGLVGKPRSATARRLCSTMTCRCSTTERIRMLHCEVNIRTRVVSTMMTATSRAVCRVSGAGPIVARRDRRHCNAPAETRAPRRQKRGTGQRPPVSQLPVVLCPIPPDDRITVDGALVHRQCAPHWTRVVGPPPEEPAAPAVPI